MTIYVDPLLQRGWIMYGQPIASCHMITSEADLDDLHAFAEAIGMQVRWFQRHAAWRPHYDLTAKTRAAALAAGAVEVTGRRLIEILRERKRRILALGSAA
jgi:hypothetical protein